MKALRAIYDPKIVAEYQRRLKDYYGENPDLRLPAGVGFILIPLGFLLFGAHFALFAIILFGASAYCYQVSTRPRAPTNDVPCAYCGEAPFDGYNSRNNPTTDMCHQCGHWLVWMRAEDEEREASKEPSGEEEKP